jgi:hypothetical protein
VYDIPDLTRRFVRSAAWRFNRALTPPEDSLSAFPSEDGPLDPIPPPHRSRHGGVATIALLSLLGSAIPVAAGFGWWMTSAGAAPDRAGAIARETRAPAAATRHTSTPPVRQLLATSPHAAPARTTGELRVDTAPPGARVSIDRQLIGTAPVDVANLAVGRHQVSVEGARGRITRTVEIAAGKTVAMVVEIPASAPSAGWIAVRSPVAVRILEGDTLLGSSEVGRLLLPAGRHKLEFINEALGYQAARAVTVSPGRVSEITLDLPRGTVHLNALPWAEVFVDGRRVGETPIANLLLPIGEHAIVFRHPQLGEQQKDIVVGVTTPVRVGVELRP